MRSAKLEKLEALSVKQADQSRVAVEQQRAELQLMDQQHQDLKNINDEYQYGVVGADPIAPVMLAHRRAFVAQLSIRLDLLKEARVRNSELLQEKVDQHQQHAGQSAALATMAERERDVEKLAADRSEQRQQEDSLHALKLIQQAHEDGDNA